MHKFWSLMIHCKKVSCSYEVLFVGVFFREAFVHPLHSIPRMGKHISMVSLICDLFILVFYLLHLSFQSTLILFFYNLYVKRSFSFYVQTFKWELNKNKSLIKERFNNQFIRTKTILKNQLWKLILHFS